MLAHRGHSTQPPSPAAPSWARALAALTLAGLSFAVTACTGARSGAVTGTMDSSGGGADAGGTDVPGGAGDDGAGTLPDLGAPVDAPSEPDAGSAPDLPAGCEGAPPLLATSAEGTSVLPQTALHLAVDDVCLGAAPDHFAWSVDAPEGSVSLFLPGADALAPTFEVNVAGTYAFQVRAFDAAGGALGVSPELIVEAVPGAGIHVELLWDTPDDSDQTDEGPGAGSDLDLHFVRPAVPMGLQGEDLDGDGAPDPYFQEPWDTCPLTHNPDAGGGHVPSLDRDDTDGAGPENLNVASPEDLVYLVAVHSWDDHGYGPSVATVRVYIDGGLAWESAPTELVMGDLWRVGTITWPGGAVTPATADGEPGGPPFITPDYCPTMIPCP